MEQQKFQSTPPRRRRPSNILAAPAAQDYFNPRLREGGDIKMHLYVNHDGFQSTPPRRRRLCTISCTPATTRISTHASAKEATEVGMTYFSVFLISIHASAKEATRKYRRLLPDYDFNPRLREGGDAFHSLFIAANVISIHASAKEATLMCHKILLILQFQSTPPRRRRQSLSPMYCCSQAISIHASAKEATKQAKRRRR